MWTNTGQRRPDFAIEPGPGQESVWDYPRPPALVDCAQTVEVRAGDVLIWQENLIHGGSPRTDLEQTRMSMVIHAFAEPTLIYYDSTGMSGRRQTSLA